MVEIVRYHAQKKEEWNTFIKDSKNGTFLFQREFMEYHSDRFEDHSLMCYYKGKLLAVLPANIKENTLYSHQGLTYGSFILSNNIKLHVFVAFVKDVLKYLNSINVISLYVKLIPEIYHTKISNEFLGLMGVLEARLEKQEISLAVNLKNELKYHSKKRGHINKAKRQDFNVEVINESSYFIDEIVNPNLKKKFGVSAVHTSGELSLLKTRFPNSMKQYAVFFEKEMVAGALLFITSTTVHAQYISGTELHRKLGAIDLLIDKILSDYKEEKLFFNFGVSSENGGKQINKGLYEWKEGFGTFPVIHSTYSIATENYSKLDSFLI